MSSETRKAHYRNKLATHGESPKALQWSSYKAPAMRFRELVADIPVEGKKILDAGCGMGDLLPFLYAKGADFSYIGVDITPEFIDIAEKRYLGHEFQVADPFADSYQETFDIVLSSGVMNGNRADWLEERKQMIAKLYSLATQVCAFTMAGSMAGIKRSNGIAYANPQEILDFCLTLTPKVILRAHYSPKDFTIIMFR